MADVIAELRARAEILEPSLDGLTDLRDRRRRRETRRRVAAATVGLAVTAAVVVVGVRIATLDVSAPPRPPIMVATVGELRPAWERRLGPVAGASAADGVLAVAQRDGRIVALDASSGRPRWTAMLGTEVAAPPAVAEGVVAVEGSDGTLRVFPATCSDPCEPRWTAPTGSTLGRPVVGGGVVAIVGDDGLLSVFPEDCSERCAPAWTAEVGGTVLLERWFDRVYPMWPSEPRAEPAIADGIVWDASDGILRAFPVDCRSDGGSCTPVAVVRPGGVERFTSPPVVAGGRLLIASTASLTAYDVACADGGPCEQLWRAPLGAINTEPPVVAGSTVVVHAFSTLAVAAYPVACEPVADRCEASWRSDPGRTTAVDPIVIGDVVFTASVETGLEAFPVDCSSPCSPLVALPAADPAWIVAPTDGLLVLVGEDGTARAFGAPRR